MRHSANSSLIHVLVVSSSVTSFLCSSCC